MEHPIVGGKEPRYFANKFVEIGPGTFFGLKLAQTSQWVGRNSPTTVPFARRCAPRFSRVQNRVHEDRFWLDS
jgi:hypothetical protein